MNPELQAQLDKLAEPLKKAITESYYQHISDAELRAEQKVREELNEKYDVDQRALVTALNAMVTESINTVLSEFRSKAKSYGENTERMVNEGSAFIKNTLAECMKEIKEDRQKLIESFDSFNDLAHDTIVNVVTDIAKELNEEKDNYVVKRAKLLTEGAKAIESRKKAVIKESVEKIADWVESLLESEISEFKEDIKVAQRNTFGQKIFERLAPEFKAVFLNENAEIQAMKERLSKMNEQVNESVKIVSVKDSQIKQLRENLDAEKNARKRDEIFNANTKLLSEDKVRIMREMTKNVETNKLAESIQHYMPFVLKNRNEKVFVESEVKPVQTPVKKIVKTGDRKTVVNEAMKTVEQHNEDKNLTEILDMLV